MYADTLLVEQPSTTLGCNRLMVSWARQTPTGTTEDRVTIGVHIAKVVGGGLFSALLPAEFPPIEASFDILYSTMKTLMTTQYSLAEYRWFEHRASHGAYDDGSEVVGPPVRIVTKTGAGTSGSARLPDQDASTITFRTASRKHWGRIYWPGLTTNNLDATTARWSTTFVDSLASSFRTFQTALTGNAQTICVWSYRKKAVLDLSELRVDDVVDIQRRRRVKQATYFRSYTS